jgi:hypothetical protein
MELPKGKVELFRYTPTASEKEAARHLAEEYVVLESRGMAYGIAAYERHGEEWLDGCTLRPVLDRALLDPRKARTLRMAA